MSVKYSSLHNSVIILLSLYIGSDGQQQHLNVTGVEVAMQVIM